MSKKKTKKRDEPTGKTQDIFDGAEIEKQVAIEPEEQIAGNDSSEQDIDWQGIDREIDIDLTDISVDREVYAESRVQSINPLKPLSRQVALDIDDLRVQGYITPGQLNTPLTNTFRMIKRPLLNIAAGKGSAKPKNPNVIMVSSSVSGEGKSYVSINLAISIAMERDKNVLLIDADVVKPTHHEIFGLGDRDGLTDLLLGWAGDASDVICKTNIPSFSLMTTGSVIDHATELLASQAMEDFVEELAARYPDRIVIIDSPPLLMTTEASVLAPNMGQVILVVEAEKTRHSQVESSLGLLANEVTFLVLNKVRGFDDGGGYGYYGYGSQS